MGEAQPIGPPGAPATPWWPALSAFPWHRELAAWSDDLVIRLPRGLHRHVVRFIDGPDGPLALKELDDALVHRELAMLGHLAARSLPSVSPVGAVLSRRDDAGRALAPILVTAHLPYALPLRNLFVGTPVRPDLHERLVDALAVLLARLHLSGFFWGDCSLSNALFRRDAGDLAAYVVDTETAETHAALSDGQRRLDVDIACENVAGGLADLAAGGRLGLDDGGLIRIVDQLERRYGQLWTEITRVEQVGSGELWRFQDRVRRLNELGFDVREVEIADASAGQAQWRPAVIEAGHHARQLRRLVGIEAEENQARRLLTDLWGYGAQLCADAGRWLPEAVQAYRWLTQRWEPALVAVPAELRGRLPDPELYHQVLDHLWLRSEVAGRDIGIVAAVQSFAAEVLVTLPDEGDVVSTLPDAPSGSEASTAARSTAPDDEGDGTASAS